MRRWGPIAVLALLPLLALWRCVLLGEVLGPWDQVKTFSPWGQSAPNEPFDVLQMDAALQFYVWRDLVFESWRSGQAPLYNPYALGGTALAGNSQSGAFYPLHILVGVLAVPAGLAITLLAWFHLFWAGLGVYLLCRRLEGLVVPSLFAGGAFLLSPFMLSWVGIASVPTTVSWIPWILLGLVAIFGNSHDDFPWLPLTGTSLAMGMMILGGHLQFVAYGVMAAAVVWLGLTIKHRSVKFSAVSLAALGAGLLVALPHIKLVLEWSEFSHRRGVPTEAGFQSYSASALQWWEFASVGTADLLGAPGRLAGDPFSPLSTFWGALVKAGGNYAESAISVGIVVFCLALASLRGRGANAAIFGGLIILALLLTTASPLSRALYFEFPGWSATGSPGRAGVLFVLGFCVLAGLFKPAQGSSDPSPLKNPQTQMILFGFALVGVLSVLVRIAAPNFASWSPGITADFMREYVQRSISPFQGLTFGVVAIVTLAYGLGKAKASWSSWLLVAGAISLVPALLTVKINSGHPPKRISSVGSERVAVLNRNWELIVLSKATLPPNLATFNRVAEIGGYDSLIHRSLVNRVAEINGADPAPPANGNMMFVKSDQNRALLVEAGVTRIWSGVPLEGFDSVTVGDHEIYEARLDGPGVVSLKGESLSEVEFTTYGMRVNATGPGNLVIRMQPLPSTRLFINGRSVNYTMEDGWPTANLSSGGNRIEFRAESSPLLWAGLLLPALSLILGIRQQKRAQKEEPPEPAESGT